MRDLWPLEAAILNMFAAMCSVDALAIRQQTATMVVREFRNSGAGFFSELQVDPDVALICGRSPLLYVGARVVGLGGPGMGFILFHDGGRARTLEGFRYGDVDTRQVDFANASFELLKKMCEGADRLAR